MRLQAISVGIEAPAAAFSAVVHSIFTRACNLRTGAGSLVTLLTAEQQNLPCAIRVEAHAAFDFTAHTRSGQQVTCEGNIARFAGGALQVDLSAVQLWHVDLGALGCDLRQAGAYRAWRAVMAELRAARHDCGLSAMLATHRNERVAGRADVRLLARRGARAVAALIACACSHDAQGALAPAAQLVGLGPGLTPSGDDFLVGFLAGMWACARDDTRRRAFLASFGSGLARLAEATGDVSRAYLLSAIAGNASERLALLATLIARGATPLEVRAATRAALAVGATSGADGVIGLLAGTAAWSPRAGAAIAALAPQR